MEQEHGTLISCRASTYVDRLIGAEGDTDQHLVSSRPMDNHRDIFSNNTQINEQHVGHWERCHSKTNTTTIIS